MLDNKILTKLYDDTNVLAVVLTVIMMRDITIPCCAGDDVLLDIGPVTGTLQFISGVTQQQFNLLVVPDDVPEITEVLTPITTGITFIRNYFRQNIHTF